MKTKLIQLLLLAAGALALRAQTFPTPAASAVTIDTYGNLLTPTIAVTATASSGATAVTLSSTTGIVPGALVTGIGIAGTTTVSAVSNSSTISLSAATTTTLSGGPLAITAAIASTATTSLNLSKGSVTLSGASLYAAIVAGGSTSISQSGGILYIYSSSGGGGGSVTTFSATSLSPLFTVNVANAGTTPALSFTAVSISGGLFYASPSLLGGIPSFRSIADGDLPTDNLGPYLLKAGGSLVLGPTSFSSSVSLSGPVTFSGAVSLSGTTTLAATGTLLNIGTIYMTTGSLAGQGIIEQLGQGNPNKLFVSPSGSDSTAIAGDIAHPWGSPVTANAVAVAGQTVYEFPGTYTATSMILVKPGVTFIGDSSVTVTNAAAAGMIGSGTYTYSNPYLIANSAYANYTQPNTSPATTSSNIEVGNMSFNGNAPNNTRGPDFGQLMYLNAIDHSYFHDLNFYNSQAFNISLYGSNNVTFKNIYINHSSLYVNGDGIHLGGDQFIYVENLHGITNDGLLAINGREISATATTTASTTTGSVQISVGSASGISVGNFALGPNIPASTTVSTISGTTLSLSQAATGSTTSENIVFNTFPWTQAGTGTEFDITGRNITMEGINVSVSGTVAQYGSLVQIYEDAAFGSQPPFRRILIDGGQGITDVVPVVVSDYGFGANFAGSDIDGLTIMNINATNAQISAATTLSSVAGEIAFMGGEYGHVTLAHNGQSYRAEQPVSVTQSLPVVYLNGWTIIQDLNVDDLYSYTSTTSTQSSYPLILNKGRIYNGNIVNSFIQPDNTNPGNGGNTNSFSATGIFQVGTSTESGAVTNHYENLTLDNDSAIGFKNLIEVDANPFTGATMTVNNATLLYGPDTGSAISFSSSVTQSNNVVIGSLFTDAPSLVGVQSGGTTSPNFVLTSALLQGGGGVTVSTNPTSGVTTVTAASTVLPTSTTDSFLVANGANTTTFATSASLGDTLMIGQLHNGGFAAPDYLSLGEQYGNNSNGPGHDPRMILYDAANNGGTNTGSYYMGVNNAAVWEMTIGNGGSMQWFNNATGSGLTPGMTYTASSAALTVTGSITDGGALTVTGATVLYGLTETGSTTINGALTTTGALTIGGALSGVTTETAANLVLTGNSLSATQTLSIGMAQYPTLTTTNSPPETLTITLSNKTGNASGDGLKIYAATDTGAGSSSVSSGTTLIFQLGTTNGGGYYLNLPGASTVTAGTMQAGSFYSLGHYANMPSGISTTSISTGTLSATGAVTTSLCTVATLPSATTSAGYQGSPGSIVTVTDSAVTVSSTTVGTTPTGGSTNRLLLFSNGSAWIIP